GRRYDNLTTGGLHYHKNLLTPYWDPVGGAALDLTYAAGNVEADGSRTAQQFIGQASTVLGFPDFTGHAHGKLEGFLAYLADTRLAVRLYGAGGIPDDVEYFALGSGTLLRGYDQRERQGSVVWVGSLEWRLPVAQMVQWDLCDHVIGVRNVS